MLGSNERWVECKSLGINNWDFEEFKEQPLLGYKYNSIYGDELLTTEGFPDLISDGICLDNSGGKSNGFPVRESYGATLGFSDSSILGVANYSKVNILCLALIKEMKNAFHLTHVNEIFKESRGTFT